MSIPRAVMVLAMLLLLVGLVYGMSLHAVAPLRGMTVELSCLALGSVLFVVARRFDRRAP